MRHPRLRLLLGGREVDGCRSAEITTRGGSQASSFRAVVSNSGVVRTLGPGWMDQDAIAVAVDFGFLAEGDGPRSIRWVRMMTGRADRIAFDPVTGLAALDGRDNAALLIDMPLQDSYLNKTSSELAELLAARSGLAADVDATTELIGQYYQIEHAKTTFGAYSRHGNGWDLLHELATIEGYDLWVDGSALHFKTMAAAPDAVFGIRFRSTGAAGPQPTLDVSDIALDRTIGLSGPIQVTVTSWNSRQRQQVKAAYPADADASAARFLILKPNLLPDQVETLARTTYRQLRGHRRTIRGTMAGELSVTPRCQVRLGGTGTGWDGVYSIDEIERRMSFEHGFNQSIVGRMAPDGEDGDE